MGVLFLDSVFHLGDFFAFFFFCEKKITKSVSDIYIYFRDVAFSGWKYPLRKLRIFTSDREGVRGHGWESFDGVFKKFATMKRKIVLFELARKSSEHQNIVKDEKEILHFRRRISLEK